MPELKKISLTQERTLQYIRAWQDRTMLTDVELAKTNGAGVPNAKSYGAVVRSRLATEGDRTKLKETERYKLTDRGRRYLTEVVDVRKVEP